MEASSADAQSPRPVDVRVRRLTDDPGTTSAPILRDSARSAPTQRRPVLLDGTPPRTHSPSEVNLLGLFFKAGDVLSSGESGQYLATWNRIASAPTASRTAANDDVQVDRLAWRDAGIEVELMAIVGGGHGMPQA